MASGTVWSLAGLDTPEKHVRGNIGDLFQRISSQPGPTLLVKVRATEQHSVVK